MVMAMLWLFCHALRQSRLSARCGRPLRHICLLTMRPVQTDIRAQRTLQTLRQQGYSVTIVDVVEANLLPMPHIKCTASAQLRHLAVSRWRTIRRRHPWLFCWLTLLLFVRALWLLVRLPVDVYHACDTAALPVCYLAACLRRKRLIYDAYELPLHAIPRAELNYIRRGWHLVLACCLPSMLARCAGVITVSPPIVTLLQRRYHLPRVILVRNMPVYRRIARTDLLRSRLQLPATTRIALYQGYLQADRGLDLLVRAARYLASDIVIVLMGEASGPVRAELGRLIADMHVAERVKILPPVPYESLLDWTASADLGLLLTPLDGTLNMRYSLPNKLFEYLMAGLPALTAPLVAVSAIVQHYDAGRVLAELTPQRVAAELSALLNDRSTLALFRAHALAAARECCWEREQEQLAALYRTLLL